MPMQYLFISVINILLKSEKNKTIKHILQNVELFFKRCLFSWDNQTYWKPVQGGINVVINQRAQGCNRMAEVCQYWEMITELIRRFSIIRCASVSTGQHCIIPLLCQVILCIWHTHARTRFTKWISPFEMNLSVYTLVCLSYNWATTETSAID